MKIYSLMKIDSFLLLFTFFIVFGFRASSTAEAPGREKRRLYTSGGDIPQNQAPINVGNMVYWMFSDGTSGCSPHPGEGGVKFPGYSSGTSVVNRDGIVWGGLVRDGVEPVLRVGGQAGYTGTSPGRIHPQGQVYAFDKVWRIRKDVWDLGNYDWGELSDDVEELLNIDWDSVTDEQVRELKDLYALDWEHWPVVWGAPFYDADGDGMYTPRFRSDGKPVFYPDGDEPGLANADQVIWTVCHDLDTAQTNQFAGSPPIGLELQTCLWGYRRGIVYNSGRIFKRVRLIYKGTESAPADARIDSMFLGVWVDPAIGRADNDLVGCDTTLNLGFVYNETTFDEQYVSYDRQERTPAMGYDIIKGLAVPAAGFEISPGQWQWAGEKSLPMTRFGYYCMGDDPALNSYEGTLAWWRLFNGQNPETGEPWKVPDAYGGGTTMFMASGDPITTAGWTDAEPGDKRMLLVCGPFSMALGDTAEMTIAVVGGRGDDQLMSIYTMKYNDRSVQNFFENSFGFPGSLPLPQVSATEMDGRVLLSWSLSQDAVETVEDWEDAGYRFEGYNVYQKYGYYDDQYWTTDWIKLATFDVKNDVTTIIQEVYDREIPGYITQPVQTGTNSGIQRSLLIEWDEAEEQPLINGQEYCFGVTAYSYTPDPAAVIRSLESDKVEVYAVPEMLKPGLRLHAAMGDRIPTAHPQGSGNGSVEVIVTNPYALTGDEYAVSFREVAGAVVWYLENTTSDVMLLQNQTNQSGDDEYLETDGFMCMVIASAGDDGFTVADYFTFSTVPYRPTVAQEDAQEDVKEIKVYPNPFYGDVGDPLTASERFVTFSHLPQRAVIRIFSLSGTLIRTIHKDDASQFARWDLLNESGRFIASGMYIAHIDMPDLGVQKVLKIGVAQY